ncbi:GDSL-type esterase/lipase family protein [Phocaeicola sp.]|uniref:GDSL-type esterase/lipase family protein n=1 Tax=Phocaeicola sp. TaxID=2773926 RepID=UPI0023BD7CB8|nr:GDSL-type esterase/lipase family protein [Phocaeicola sp.]MDE5678188.1 sialate O-acetylesterase [Phocaeicola sp.]
MKRIVVVALCMAFCIVLSAREIVKVACVGNSITYGIGVADPDKESYPAQLQHMLGEEYVVQRFGKPGATLLNKGHRPFMKQQEFRDALNFAADVVVIHLGVNDTDPRDWPNYRDAFITDYRALIDSFRVANPKCRILIARLTPIADRHPRFESGTRDWHGEIQLAIETIARNAQVQLIDFHSLLYSYPYMLPDAVHPDKEGAAILAKTVYEGITGDFGGLQMPEIYTDNMVLQHGRPLTVRGKADAGQKVTVSIDKKKFQTMTGLDGKWMVNISPLKAGGPYTLMVSDEKKTLVYNNVLAGEVWLCSGQSNMEFHLNWSVTAEQDVPQATNDNIRFYDMKARWRTDAVEWDDSVLDSLNHLQYYKNTHWTVCSPEMAGVFSAVAYYFGKKMQDSLQIPIGLICNAIGGSPTEAWVDRRTLEYCFPAILRNWKQNDFIQDWVRGRAALNIKKTACILQRHPYEPCYLYESGIRPLEQFPIRGVIWYQGESNAHNREAHEKLFKLLVDSWRKNWGDEELPFYFVQLSGMDRPSWTWFRDSQRKLMMEIPYTGMAVCSDKGDSLDVHPKQKKEVGERLAAWALNKTYGYKHITPSGPLYKSVSFHKGAAYVSFDYAEGLSSSDGMPVRTFEVAGEDGVFYPAQALIENGKMKVWNDQVNDPRIVRYGWQPFTRANLVNSAGLPASTFQTE